VNNACGSVADRTTPGELLRLVADGLTGGGFDVRPPEHDGSCRMTIACAGARCTLAVSDWGCAEWEYFPWSSDDADPKLAADLATTLLTGRAGGFPRLGSGYEREGIAFKGIVGLELKARGLEVYSDEDYFDAHAEIVVTSPGSQDDDATVCVTDDGCLTWTRDYWAEAATIVFEPGSCGWIADPASVAAAVVQTITRAMSCVRTGRQVRPA